MYNKLAIRMDTGFDKMKNCARWPCCATKDASSSDKYCMSIICGGVKDTALAATQMNKLSEHARRQSDKLAFIRLKFW